MKACMKVRVESAIRIIGPRRRGGGHTMHVGPEMGEEGVGNRGTHAAAQLTNEGMTGCSHTALFDFVRGSVTVCMAIACLCGFVHPFHVARLGTQTPSPDRATPSYRCFGKSISSPLCLGPSTSLLRRHIPLMSTW